MSKQPIDSSGGIEVLVGDGDVYTREVINGVKTYLRWDHWFSELYTSEIRLRGFPMQWFMDEGGLFMVSGFPIDDKTERMKYITRHLEALKKYADEKNIKLVDYADGACKKIMPSIPLACEV